MRTWFSLAMGAVLVSLAALPAPAVAQEKTAKACREEWQANKAANQAAGITEKAYVDKCRAGASTAAQPAPAPSATPAPAAAPAAGKTAKACREEWQANKAANQAAGITEKAYVDKCRAGEQVAAPSTPASPPPPAPPPARSAAPTPPPASPAVKPSATAVTPAPTGAGQFTTEAQAKSHCPADIVVWVNLKSKKYHFAGYKNYGNTKEGAYMCEKQATGDGFVASKNEKRPGA
jgi:hypothetical protein